MIVQLPDGNFFDLRTFSCTSTHPTSKSNGQVILSFHLTGQGFTPSVECASIDEARRVARDVIDYMQSAEIEDTIPIADDDEPPDWSAAAALRLNITPTTTGLQVIPIDAPDTNEIADRCDTEAARRERKAAHDDRRSKAISAHRPVGAPSFVPDKD